MRVQMLELLAVLLLAASTVASGVLVVRAKHQARQLFIELEEINREQDRLQIDWGRLQLEQSTLGTHPRIESIARDQLHLTAPTDEQLVVVVKPQQ
jgi:cell division protein FtsL